MKRILKSTAVMLLLFFAFAATYAQCSSGNRLEVSNSYTLASGNTGVAIFFRNSTYSWNPASLTKLSFDVTLNGCSPYINRAILTSFNGKATATITSNSTAHFSFSNSSNPFQLVDNEVTMILELAQCSGFGSVDVVISNIAMEISNTPISTAACNGEAVIQSCASSCNTSSRHLTVFGPYTGFTGNPFVAIIYNTPNTFDNVRGLYVKLYASGDLNILNVYSSVLGSGANTSNNGKTASLFYWGATQQLVTWDPVMILELSGNSTCGHINFCSEFLYLNTGGASLSGCNSAICTQGNKAEINFPVVEGTTVEDIQAPTNWGLEGLETPVLSPNPFGNATTLSFEAAQPGQVELTVTNQLGQVVDHQMREVPAGTNTFEINGSDMPQGIYFYMLKTSTKSVTGRMVHQ